MYSLIKGHGVPGRLARELPAGGAAFVIAELFYKFHSFSLECLAFLGTWLALSWTAHALFPVKERRESASARQ